MQFYKFNGTIENFNPTDKAAEEDVRINEADIAQMTRAFNDRPDGNAFCFLDEMGGGRVTIGVICASGEEPEKRLSGFTKALGLTLSDIRRDEISLEKLQKMLTHADRLDHIDDCDEVMDRFDLCLIASGSSFGLHFYEKLVKEADKDAVYGSVYRLLMRDEVSEEISRIYNSKAPEKLSYHPAHYLVETDNEETLKAVQRSLVQALYQNHRVKSRRYSHINFRSGYGFSKKAFDDYYKSNEGGTVCISYKTGSDDEEGSSSLQQIEVICQYIKKYRNKVLTILHLPTADSMEKAIFLEKLSGLTVVGFKDRSDNYILCHQYLRNLARDNHIRTDKKLFEKLKEQTCYSADDLNSIFEAWVDKKLKAQNFPEYEKVESVKPSPQSLKATGSAADELEEMIGLAGVKSIINKAVTFHKASRLLRARGFCQSKPSMHMVFTGNPGTAKTTVARLFAQIMKENGVLSSGHIVEVGRAQLVGKYVGQTAPLVRAAFEKAEGGVLFIDEAYSLVEDRGGSYGDEAINTIVQEMENRRNSVVVILAGYPTEMEKFLDKNPGLRSRIAFHVPFEDYSTPELCEISSLIAKKGGMSLSEGALKKLETVFDVVRRNPDFGNGRYVRNIIESASMSMASRLVNMDLTSVTKEDAITILEEDIEVPKINPAKLCRQIGFCG